MQTNFDHLLIANHSWADSKSLKMKIENMKKILNTSFFGL
jgi:hypothetical protein